MLKKSEKWVPIYTITFFSLMFLGCFICAWVDPERYSLMVKAVVESIGDLRIVAGIIMAGSLWFSEKRHDYKKFIITKNGYISDEKPPDQPGESS